MDGWMADRQKETNNNYTLTCLSPLMTLLTSLPMVYASSPCPISSLSPSNVLSSFSLSSPHSDSSFITPLAFNLSSPLPYSALTVDVVHSDFVCCWCSCHECGGKREERERPSRQCCWGRLEMPHRDHRRDGARGQRTVCNILTHTQREQLDLLCS